MVMRKWPAEYHANFSLWVAVGISVIHARIMIVLSSVVCFFEVGVRNEKEPTGSRGESAPAQLLGAR